MIKKVFRPFWSFDVQKTEKWLSNMAEKGLHIVEFNRFTHIFVFEEGDKKEMLYQIDFDKKQSDTLPKALKNEGWVKVCRNKHWYIVANQQRREEVNLSPHREGVITHSRKVLYIYGAISAYLLFSLVLQTVFFSVIIISESGWDVERNVSEYFTAISTILGFATIFLIFYITFKLYRSNERLSQGIEEQNETSLFSRNDEKRLKRSGDVVVKRKFAWWYSPDKLEEWLEKMELAGYNLYRTNKYGIKFYFRKGEPRKVRYCIDYQNTVYGSYYDMHQESGWNLVYTSKSSWMKWTIWSLEYDSESERPEMYTDRTNHLKQARRITFINVGSLLPIAFVAWVILSSPDPFPIGGAITTLIFFILFTSAIVLHAVHGLKSMMYYRRVKKSLQN
ncbi:DUF2812 domain-containing protein [Salipaludibacillus sp. HK11]|uniref:DUF2812 domain-containing protein n=1 Tax=Salipaludibacillus sp. HK11 TaxID=3394320 RepID=UPI0039FD9109